MILLPNGTVVHHMNANTLLDTELSLTDSLFEVYQDPFEKTYALFLEEGLRKAEKYFLDDT